MKNTTTNKKIADLLSGLTKDNVSIYQKENGKEHDNSADTVLLSITNALYYLTISKRNWVARLISEAKEFAASPYAGTDTHESALQSKNEYIQNQEIIRDEAEMLTVSCQKLYKKRTGITWSKPISKDERELLAKSRKATASAVDFEETIAKHGEYKPLV